MKKRNQTDLAKDVSSLIKGDVSETLKAKKEFSHDTYLFEVKPDLIVYPKDTNDIKKLVKYVSENKKKI